MDEEFIEILDDVGITPEEWIEMAYELDKENNKDGEYPGVYLS